jgi:predicted nucleotide-binding protein
VTAGLDLFAQINTAVLDLQQSHLQTYHHSMKKLSRLLEHEDLAPINRALKEKADFDAFVKESEATQGSMVGSAQLLWPEDPEVVLGLQLGLIERCASVDGYAENLAFTFFYSGNKIISNLNALTRQFIIPFARDYKTFVLNRGSPKAGLIMPTSNKIFIVHGHDEAALQGLARFLEKLDLKVIVLREQPDQGRTIIEKFEQSSADVGFAVVLMTPDDVGSSVGATDHDARTRQNVIFELGFFAGKLGRGRVCLLRKGDVEIPSDLFGVIYTEMDPAGGWHSKLVRELKAANLQFDADRLWA